MKKFISLIVLISSLAFAQIQKYNLNSSSFKYEINSNLFQLNISETNFHEKKSPGLAIIYSLILPGMGELYAGGYESGKYFTIAEGILIGTYAGFNIYGNNQKENYIAFAKSNAGINLEGKESDFIANVGIYISSQEYNRIQELNRNFDKTYSLPSQQWNWQSNDFRKQFRNMWTSSENAYNSLKFVAGAMLLNRIISAINAVRLVSAYNKNLTQEINISVFFNIESKPTLPQSITFNLIKRF